MRGRQGRFLGITIGGWIVLRMWMLWPGAPVGIAAPPAMAALAGGSSTPHFAPARNFEPLRLAATTAEHATVAPDRPAGASAIELREARPASPRLIAPERGPATVLPRAEAEVERRASLPPAPIEPPTSASPTRATRMIEGQAYLFVRPGSKRAALAPGGSLGGAQAAARIAIALNRFGPVRTAIAARVYAPLGAKGAEAAVGLDWHPLAEVPLRLSIERRIGLDRAGRDAWSAYAAGGFYRGGLPLGLEADGYAQAGVVGARRRDLFADGALRIGRRMAVGPVEATAGVGGWGAAQPGAARLDLGPRLALSLPVERHRLTLALEGRLRIAGRASPGSGTALTLAADF